MSLAAAYSASCPEAKLPPLSLLLPVLALKASASALPRTVLPSRALLLPTLHFPLVMRQGLTTMLYPLSVIKTRQMALEGSQSGLRVRGWLLSPPFSSAAHVFGAVQTAKLLSLPGGCAAAAWLMSTAWLMSPAPLPWVLSGRARVLLPPACMPARPAALLPDSAWPCFAPPAGSIPDSSRRGGP